MLLPGFLAKSAERFPEKTALAFPSETISFGELEVKSSQVSAYLKKAGIGPAARVAILHENAVSAVVFFWGVLKSGAQVLEIPCLAGVGTISDILAESKPAAMVISESQWQRLAASPPHHLPPIILSGRPLRPEFGSREFRSLSEIAVSETPTAPAPRVSSWDVALIIYTSGTTGTPKGVMLSHDNLVSNITAVNSLMKLTSEDSILAVVPLHFIHGVMQLLTHAMVGGTVAFSAGFQFPQRVLEELIRWGTTGFSGVPYHFSMLLQHSNIASTRLPHLKYVVVMGGALAPHQIQRLSDALPGIAIHIGYGQTETSPRITILSPSDLPSKAGSCGVPIPGVQVEIVDENGIVLVPGTVGEIVVSGPNVMRGYVSGDEISSGTIDSLGRLHTGDLGNLDDDGYLYILGRKSEMIKSAGERVFPREIETVLDAHPGVSESAVLGIPDDVLGERIVACVVAAPAARTTAAELRTHCLKSLPLVRVPREIRFCGTVPKTSSGKLDRTKLAEHFFAIGAPGESVRRAASGSERALPLRAAS